MDIEVYEIIKGMSDYQKESIKKFYDCYKTGIKTCGSRAGKCMGTLIISGV
jgi:hypothetical protein